jgi:hypothetical protein
MSITLKTKVHLLYATVLVIVLQLKYRPTYERNSNSVAMVVFSAQHDSMYVAQRMRLIGNWPSGSTFLSSVTQLRGRKKKKLFLYEQRVYEDDYGGLVE